VGFHLTEIQFMATIRKSGSGWQALIRRKGHNGPKSKTFQTRFQAESWAKATEEQLRPQRIGQAVVPLTLSDAIEAFIEGPLKSHRSAANELYPLRATAKSWIGNVLLSELAVRHLATWRDQRLAEVKANTVMRELRVLRVLLDWARDERGAELHGNPARELKVKAGSDSRVAFLSREEERKLLQALERRKNPDNAFLVQLALTTAMRRSELLALRWEDLDLENRIAHLNRKDCAASGRQQSQRLVPLSKATVKLLRSKEGGGSGRVIRTTCCSSRAAFERSKQEAGLSHLRFHDLRHVAISRLWMEGYSALEISAASGHRDLKMLMRYSHYAPNP
jgi:integrase